MELASNIEKRPESRMERGIKALLERAPGTELPTRDNPAPESFVRALRKYTVTGVVRGMWDARNEPPFHMLDDIHDQPGLCRDLISHREEDIEKVAKAIAAIQPRHIVSTGCGTAFYSAMMGNGPFLEFTETYSEALEAFELLNYSGLKEPERTVIIAHSGTGSSGETVEAARYWKERGAMIVALTNEPDSILENIADHTVVCSSGQRTGPCMSIVSVRMIAEYLLAGYVGLLQRGRDARILSALDQIRAIPDILDKAIKEKEAFVSELANRYRGHNTFHVVGAGPSFGLALEVALKIIEGSEAKLKAVAFETVEWLHCGLSQTTPEVVTIFIDTPGKGSLRMKTALEASRHLGGPVLVISGETKGTATVPYGDVINMNHDLDEAVAPLCYMIPLQLFTYYNGVHRSLNPDIVRNDADFIRAALTAFPPGYH